MTVPHILILLLVVTVWGFNFVAIKGGLEIFPPIFLCFARFLCCCFPAIFFIKRPRIPISQLILYSSVTFILQFSLLFLAMRSGVTPALASILLQIQSFFSIFLAVLFMGETLRRTQGIGCLISFLGILFIVKHLNHGITPLGLLLIIGAAFFWAMGSLIAKKLSFPLRDGHHVSSGLSLVVWSSLFAWPPLLALSLLLEGTDWIPGCIQHIHMLPILCVLYIAYGATIFGFGTWNRLLQIYPLSKMAPFTLLAPVVGMLSSAIVLGEVLHWWKLAAASLILSGLSLHVLGTLALSHIKSRDLQP